MDENPYQPPEHYATRPRNRVPLIAIVGNIGLLIFGSTMVGIGIYHLMPRVAVAGIFWFAIGLVGVSCMFAYWRRGP